LDPKKTLMLNIEMPKERIAPSSVHHVASNIIE